MADKRVCVVLLLLGIALYQVAAQTGGDGDGDAERRGGPILPRPVNNCRASSFRQIVYRNIFWQGRNNRCFAWIDVRRCYGTCVSFYYTNPNNLAPVKRCLCCQPFRQSIRSFTVTFTCRGANIPFNRRRQSVQAVVVNSCRCQSC